MLEECGLDLSAAILNGSLIMCKVTTLALQQELPSIVYCCFMWHVK